MPIFAEHAWRDRHFIHCALLGLLGLAAAAISGGVVLERVSHTHEARSQVARSANLPRTATAEASDACSDGRGPSCKAASLREDEARKRVTAARSQLVGLGAEAVVDPTAGVLGAHAETFRLAVLLGLPLWLELAAPIVLAYGFAPGPAKAPAPKRKAERREEKRVRRKPAAQDGVSDWVEAYRQRHGHDPKIADVRQAFGVSKSTAWRRIRSAS